MNESSFMGLYNFYDPLLALSPEH